MRIAIVVATAYLRPATALPSSRIYAITTGTYAETANLSSACVNEFGSTSRVADWVELEALGAQSVNALMDNLEVPTTFNENGYYVTNNGQKVYSGSRVYFFERHDGNPPGNWAVHSVIGDISLGSWYNMNHPVLCTLDASSTSTGTFGASGTRIGLAFVLAGIWAAHRF